MMIHSKDYTENGELVLVDSSGEYFRRVPATYDIGGTFGERGITQGYKFEKFTPAPSRSLMRVIEAEEETLP
jgi:hypothetical protein